MSFVGYSTIIKELDIFLILFVLNTAKLRRVKIELASSFFNSVYKFSDQEFIAFEFHLDFDLETVLTSFSFN